MVKNELLKILENPYLPHEEVASLVKALGDALEPSEAVRLYLRWLEAAEKSVGPDDERVTSIVRALADRYFRQENYSQAESVYGRLLSTEERLHGPNSKALADLLFCIGGLCQDLHRYPEAEMHFRRSIEIDPKHELALRGLAKLLNATGRPSEAREFELREEDIVARRWD